MISYLTLNHMSQTPLLLLAKLGASVTLCALLAACGGGGGSSSPVSQPVVDDNYQLVKAYTNIISQNRSKTYTATGVLVGLSYSAGGNWTSATANSLFNNSFAYAQKITYNETSVSIGGVAQAPSKSESLKYFDSNYRFIGALFDTGVSPIDQIKYTTIPSTAKIGESAAYLEYSTYSDATKKSLAAVTSERWSLENDSSSPTGAVLKVITTVIFADKVVAPNPLVYTDRYSVAKNGDTDILSRNINWLLPSGSSNYTYTFK